MKILICGDVVGRRGREIVLAQVPVLRKSHALDFVIVNGDNAAGGFGILPDHCKAFFEAGVDVITAGDHVWDQKDLRSYLTQEKRILRPLNFPEGTPGRGAGEFTLADGRTVLVAHPLGQVFMPDNANCPFMAMDHVLKAYRLGKTISAIIVDFHAEATSEKMALPHHLDGRVSAVVGTHTHVPTADARILPGGTAAMSDLGMCGDYDSVIGFKKDEPLAIFTSKIRKHRMQPAMGAATLSGAIITTDDKTGLAKAIEAVQLH